MYTFLKKFSLFLIFSSVFYVCVLFLWGMFAPARLHPNLNYPIGGIGHMHSRVQEVHSTQNIDLLFLGSSHTYRGFDNRIFSAEGYSSFNLGSSAQTALQTEVLLARYLEQLSPKLVVFEVYPNTFTSDGVESALDIIANDRNDVHSLRMAFAMNHLKVYNSLIYGSLREFFDLDAEFSEPISKADDTYISGGYVEKALTHYSPKKLRERAYAPNKDQLESLKRISEMIKAKDIPLVLVYAPIPSSNYERYTNNQEIDSLMSSLSTYYNFNERMQLNDSLHFYDSNHLNQLGVEEFNKALIQVITEDLSSGIE